MFKKQLTVNIEDLDLQISKLTKELGELEGIGEGDSYKAVNYCQL